MTLTTQELHVLAHTIGWEHPQTKKVRSRAVKLKARLTLDAFFRNHFSADPGHDDWPALVALWARGLMRLIDKPATMGGGDDQVFAVTEHGLAALYETEGK